MNPFTGERVREFATASDSEVAHSVADVQRAFGDWGRRTSVATRAELVGRVGALHLAKRESLARIIVSEVGKPYVQALEEVDFAAAIYRYYAENAATLLADQPIALAGGAGQAYLRAEPLGALLGIMPWNFPYYQVARFAAPNLVAGNTILLKHAPQCPESALAIERLFTEAGLPQSVYRALFASTDQIEDVIAAPEIVGVSVTGSERAGSAVAELAGRHLKKVVLELGGSDPFLVLSADDLDAVVAHALAARLGNGGQACNAAKRFIIIEHLYDEFLQRFATALALVKPGDPTAAGTALGPLSSVAAADRLGQQIDRAVASGARAVLAGERNGALVAPSILTEVRPENPAYSEEFFGPVALVFSAADEEHAIRLANDTPYGLGSYIFTNDSEQAIRVAEALETGMVFINVTEADSPELPFGGIKRSGFGRELGVLGIGEFLNRKLVRIGG